LHKGITNVMAISLSLEWEENQRLHVLFSSPMIVVLTGVSSVAAQIEHNGSSVAQDRLPFCLISLISSGGCAVKCSNQTTSKSRVLLPHRKRV